MVDQNTYSVTVTFPGDLDYIPAVRKFVSEVLQVFSLNNKFAFRSEIIVDEICGNAVTYGCKSPDAHVELTVTVSGDRVEFHTKDEGGRREDVERLRAAVSEERRSPVEVAGHEGTAAGLGLEIVRMLSEEVGLEIDESNLTSVRVVRRREDLNRRQDRQ